MAAAQLLPIIPLLLLPFAAVFFIVVFPIWAVAVGLLWLVLMLIRGLNKLAKGGMSGAEASMTKAFRWVLTFGGIARLASDEKKPNP